MRVPGSQNLSEWGLRGLSVCEHVRCTGVCANTHMCTWRCSLSPPPLQFCSHPKTHRPCPPPPLTDCQPPTAPQERSRLQSSAGGPPVLEGNPFPRLRGRVRLCAYPCLSQPSAVLPQITGPLPPPPLRVSLMEGGTLTSKASGQRAWWPPAGRGRWGRVVAPSGFLLP